MLSKIAGKQLRKKQNGIGLLELLLGLAVIAVLLVVSTRYYRAAKHDEQVNDAIATVQTIVAASNNWVVGHNDFSLLDMNVLTANGYLPGNALNDPWRGQIDLTSTPDHQHLVITMRGVPKNACISMARRLFVDTVKASINAKPSQLCTIDRKGKMSFSGVF